MSSTLHVRRSTWGFENGLGEFDMNCKPMRMALLLDWRGKGYGMPKYGLVDDEVLMRKGSAPFIATDGQRLTARRDDLLLLEAASTPAAATPEMVA
jgi:hypothetical protein